MIRPDIQDSVSVFIRRYLKDTSSSFSFEEGLDLKIPRLREFGDLTCSLAFRLASTAKKDPQQIAGELAQYLKVRIKNSPLKDKIEDIQVKGKGFINFFFTKEYFYQGLKEVILKGPLYGRQNIGKNEPVLIEFVSANPTGPLSIAHARQAAVGDTLAHIFSLLGYRAKREYYLNDEGRQIDILGQSVYLRLKELQGEKIDFPEDGYQGDYIYDIARQLISEESGIRSWELKDFSAYSVRCILESIKKELRDFGVEFDHWTSQKGIRESDKINKALEFLRKKGFIYDSEGAVWFRSTAFGDDKDRVVIKSDATFTYLAPDIAYHQDKYRRGFKKLINLWGPDHHGYINRLKAAVSALGRDSGSLEIIIVQLATIFKEGKAVTMSTRRGQYITLREVLDEVGRDAARFFFMMRRTSSHLDFDLTLAKQETPQNPVFYVQYAHARISSILAKAKENKAIAVDFKRAVNKVNFSLLKEPEELSLLRTVLQFPYILKASCEVLDPQNITVYLQDLATDFHKFYDRHRVLDEDKALSLARLSLCSSVKTVLANGLKVLGVSAPEKM